jgi:D-alanyl-D-alanine carboxypeptidase
MCLEKATARPHLEIIKEKVFGPLNMTSTYYQGREDIPSTAAQGYFDLYNNGTVANVSQLVTGSGNGYGGMYTNVYDLKKLSDAVLKGTYLSAAARQEQNAVLQEDTNYYCGVGAVKKRFGKSRTWGFGHTGRDLGYVANCFYYPTHGATIIFFVNYGTNGDSRLKQTFFDFEEEIADAVLE